MGEEQKAPLKPIKQKHFPVALLIIIVLIFLGIVGGGGYYLYKKIFKKPTATKSLTIPDNCPKNIPIYPKSKIITVTCKDDVASIESVINIDFKKVKSWYYTEVQKAGWTIRGEDSASYLFDNNNNQIGKVSISTEKKNSVIKFLVAKKDTQSPTSSSRILNNSMEDISSSLFNWEDYLNSVTPDFTSPIDDAPEWDYAGPTAEEYTDQPQEEYTEEPTEEPTEEITPEETDTPEPEITEEPTEEPTPNCWVDDKGGTYCD